MVRKFLFIALLVPFCSFMLTSSVAAAPSITVSDLQGALLTRGQLNQIMDSVNLDVAFNHVSDLDPQTGDRVGQCRLFGSDSGYAAAICLFANADGSQIDRGLRNTILSGDALQNVATNTSLVDSISNFSLLGATGQVGDADLLATFDARSSGVSLHVISDVFIQGVVTGYVYFASTTTPDPYTMGAILGAQSALLP